MLDDLLERTQHLVQPSVECVLKQMLKPFKQALRLRGGRVFQLRTVPTNSKIFLPRFMITQGIKILTSVIEIQKENWG